MPCGAACTSGICSRGHKRAPGAWAATLGCAGHPDPRWTSPGPMPDTLVHVGHSEVTPDTLDCTRHPLIHTGYLGVGFLSPRKCTKAAAFLQSLYKSHTFTEASTLQGGVSLGCVASQDSALALLHPWVVLHQVGVQEGVLGDPFLYPLEEPVGGEGG